MLPYAEDVYKYFRLLEASTPRVKVFSIGHSEEGREMIAVAIADAKLLADAKENDARLAQLADPRKIGLDDPKARQIIDQSWPVYYITGTIHSPETGAPTEMCIRDRHWFVLSGSRISCCTYSPWVRVVSRPQDSRILLHGW